MFESLVAAASFVRFDEDGEENQLRRFRFRNKFERWKIRFVSLIILMHREEKKNGADVSTGAPINFSLKPADLLHQLNQVTKFSFVFFAFIFKPTTRSLQ